MHHSLRPLSDRVVVKELEPDRIRQSGLLVPPGSHEPPPQHGIVLAVGQGVDWWEQAGVAMPVKPGDHVVFPASAGVWVEVDEERLLVCRVGELLGVLEDERVTPLELFFDLVFVLAITQCTALMAHEHSWEGIAKGMLVLGVMWWAWVGY